MEKPAETTIVERLTNFLRSPVGGALKIAFGISVLVGLLFSVDRASLSRLTGRLAPAGILMILGVSLASHVLGAVRFKFLCDPVARLPLSLHVRQYFIGACFTLFLPSSMGGDGVRLAMLMRAGVSGSRSTSLILTERVLGAASLLFVAAIAAIWAPMTSFLRPLVFVGAASVALGLLLVARFGSRLEPRTAFLRGMLEAAKAALSTERVAPTLAVSMLYQVAAVLATVCVSFALDFDVPIALTMALAPLVWFATFLPISAGGLGVREAAFVWVFQQEGVSREIALLLSIGTYAGLVGIGLVGALCLLWQQRTSPTETLTDTRR